MRPRLAVLLLPALAVSACGGGGGDSRTAGATPSARATLSQSPASVSATSQPAGSPDAAARSGASTGVVTTDCSKGARLPEVSGEKGKTPMLAGPPQGAPPCELVVKQLVPGDGKQVKAGQTVTVHYTGWSWSTGKEFDSSWERGQPVSFPLAGVIQGWQQGIPKMKVGSRNLLVIPPDLGYPEGTPDGSIKAGETLVFVVDVLAAR